MLDGVGAGLGEELNMRRSIVPGDTTVIGLDLSADEVSMTGTQTQRGNERAQTADWANERCDTLRPIYVARIPGPHFMECNTNNTTHAQSTVGSVVSIQSQSGKVRIAPSVDM